MTFSTIASLLGGIGLFLLGMQMMTDGLKVAAGNALHSILRSWTSTAWRGLCAGVLITALVQSSSAVTVASVGFVNAGLLTLSQAVWVVLGANVGTTTTGWLVALVGIKVDVGVLALPLVGIGMLLKLAAGGNVRRAGFGAAVAGFGAFFLGVGFLQGAFAEIAPRIGEWSVGGTGWTGRIAFVGVGALLTMLTQSSSASVAITLTAAAGGALPAELAAATVIGANVGTTSTAWLASLGATPPAKRAAWAHISFNVVTGAVAIVILPLLLAASAAVVSTWGAAARDVPAVLAVFHTLFNLLGVALLAPFASRLVRFLSARFVTADEEIGRPAHLDATLAGVPALALRGIVLELERMTAIAFDLASRRLRGTQAEPAGRLQAEGLVQLGNAIRDFIGRMSAGVLPDDVVAALPDLMRASQHLEDVATESEALRGPRPARPSDAIHAEGASPDWAALREAVLAVLTPDGAPDQLDALARRITLHYEALKAALLKAGARGRLPVDAMEEDLLRARRLRRVAESALKARRRLAPWLAVLDGARAARAEPEPPAHAGERASAAQRAIR
ncbi:MAG TPA: Na/Pi symporter [Gammaproteobacteria bacterium]